MIKIGILQKKGYELIIVTFMRPILTFILYKDIDQFIRLLLVCQNAQTLLNLGDYKAYINNVKEINIFISEKKSPVDTAFPQLISSVYAPIIF